MHLRNITVFYDLRVEKLLFSDCCIIELFREYANEIVRICIITAVLESHLHVCGNSLAAQGVHQA